MAESTTPKKRSTPKKKTDTPEGASETPAKRTRAGTKTTRADAPRTPASGKKSADIAPSATPRERAAKPQPTAAERRAERERRAAKRAERTERRNWFLRNFMPYILGAIALFLAICFVVDLCGGEITVPDEHPMGVFGYYICYGLFGILSWVAYLIPAVLTVLIIFWQKYFQTGRVIGKIILSVVLLVLLSGLSHVIVCAANPEMAGVIDPAVLFDRGAHFQSGGVVGGILGYALYWALQLPGTIALMVLVLPLVIMGLLGVTPRDCYDAIRDKIDMARERRAERLAEEEEEDDLETYEGRPEADGAAEEIGPSSEKGRMVIVDSYTGVVQGDADEAWEDIDRGTHRGKRSTRHDAEPAPAAEDETASQAAPDPTAAQTPPAEQPRTTQTAAETVAEATVAGATVAAPSAQQAPADPPSIEEIARAAAADPANALPDPDEEDDTTEHMEVDFDEAPDHRTTTAPTQSQEPIVGRNVTFRVSHDASEAAPAASSGRTTDVHIHRHDATAVAEQGLSEEEVVLPSAHDAEGDAAVEETREYRFPSVDMLTRGPDHYASNDEEIAENTQILREVLESFRIGVRDIACSCGPTITRFEVKPDTGVRVRSIANLVDDIAMGLAKAGVRIEAPIPGKNAVGIEVPNAEPDTVYLRNILETPEFRGHKSRIAACLGADVAGRPVILDINKMPHLLIAGATGTGKSVCINSLIMSILFKAKPDEVKLILIDPKKVEFAMYRDLPHLYCPVVSDPKRAAGALNSAVNEMERRFELIEEVGVRNLAGYNEITAGDPERPPLPQMVIIIDELADLMMSAPAEVETAICRLAQKARAAGIHLIIGTQRPSVDVITGLIKANVPSRIAFTVKSGVDSRTILDTVGADKLIGRGDMLYAPIGSNKPIRAQGCFVSESEVERVVTFIKEHNDGPVYNEDFARSIEIEAAKCAAGRKKGGDSAADDFDAIGAPADGEDPKFWEVLELVVTKDKIGTSAIQRACGLGYGRAAKIIDRLEELGFVGPDPGTKQGRRVQITKQDLIQYKLHGLPTPDADDTEIDSEEEDPDA